VDKDLLKATIEEYKKGEVDLAGLARVIGGINLGDQNKGVDIKINLGKIEDNEKKEIAKNETFEIEKFIRENKEKINRLNVYKQNPGLLSLADPQLASQIKGMTNFHPTYTVSDVIDFHDEEIKKKIDYMNKTYGTYRTIRYEEVKPSKPKNIKPVEQGGRLNYLGKQKTITAPVKWKSGPTHPETHLAYITKQEQDILVKLDLYKSMNGKPNKGPFGLPSLNDGDGSGDGSSGDGSSGLLDLGVQEDQHGIWRRRRSILHAGQEIQQESVDQEIVLLEKELDQDQEEKEGTGPRWRFREGFASAEAAASGANTGIAGAVNAVNAFAKKQFKMQLIIQLQQL
jgi:hypothetical protein